MLCRRVTTNSGVECHLSVLHAFASANVMQITDHRMGSVYAGLAPRHIYHLTDGLLD